MRVELSRKLDTARPEVKHRHETFSRCSSRSASAASRIAVSSAGVLSHVSRKSFPYSPVSSFFSCFSASVSFLPMMMFLQTRSHGLLHAL